MCGRRLYILDQGQYNSDYALWKVQEGPRNLIYVLRKGFIPDTGGGDNWLPPVFSRVEWYWDYGVLFSQHVITEQHFSRFYLLSAQRNL